MSRRLKVRAQVNVTVSVQVPSVWAPDATVEQIHKQAAREALELLRTSDGYRHVSALTDPRVTVVLIDEDT